MDDEALEAIVSAVVGRVRDRLTVNYRPVEMPVTPPAQTLAVPEGGGSHVGAPFVEPKRAERPEILIRTAEPGILDDVDTAVAAARKAFEQYERMPLDGARRSSRAMRHAALAHLDEMCERAVSETGLGRVEDKRIKNRVAITKTPGPEFLEPIAQSGDDGLMLLERAPFGVICSITPCTNPTETIINNGIGMVAGGNAVVFNTHPAAKETSAWYVSLLCDAIVAAGGPENLLCCIAEPTVASAQALMRHKGVRIVVVTGGGAVVKEAMRSGKRAISAGPGNPPAVVDETAHIEAAARGIVAGASFDNNIICTCEKEIVAVADIADKLKKELREQRRVRADGGGAAAAREGAHHQRQPRQPRFRRQERQP